MTEAKKLLNNKELKEFQMTVQEYFEKGKSPNPAFLNELEKVSSRVHVSRYDALSMQMRYQVET